MNGSSHPSLGRVCHAAALGVLLVVALAMLSAPIAIAQDRQPNLVMRLISDERGLEADAGRDNLFYLELTNLGTHPITGIRFSAVVPAGWTLTFAPHEIDRLGAGSVQTVDVHIRPPRRIRQREHQISLHAVANEVRKVHRVWVTVKSPRWLLIGGAVVIAVMAAFVAIYASQSRQDPVIGDDGGRGGS